MIAPRRLVAWATLGGVLTAGVAEGGETVLRLIVPDEVSAQAARRAAGDATAPAPILILEGVEVGDGEGLTIRVLAAVPGASTATTVLGTASMVGRAQATPQPPLHKVTLAVPLNDHACKLLRGRRAVTLILKVTNSPGRPAVKLDRAFLREH